MEVLIFRNYCAGEYEIREKEGERYLFAVNKDYGKKFLKLKHHIRKGQTIEGILKVTLKK